MGFHIRTSNPFAGDRFIAVGRVSGAIILVADPIHAKTWSTREEAMPLYRRCERTMVAPNTLAIEPTPT